MILYTIEERSRQEEDKRRVEKENEKLKLTISKLQKSQDQILVEMSQMKERQKDLDNKMENMENGENELLSFLDNSSDKEEMVNQILVEMNQMKERHKDFDNKMENMKSENEVLRQKYTQQQKIIEDAQNSDNRKRKKYNFHSRYQNKVMPLPTTLERMTFSGLSSYLSKLLKQELQNTGQTGKGTGQQFRWGDSRLKIQ